MSHDEHQSSSKCSVTHLLTTRTDTSLLWSVLSPGSKVYQWSTPSRKIQNRLDARKILPSSESISTLDIEAARDGHMRPLAAFRPYLEDVHSIIVLDVASAVTDYIRTRRDATAAASAASIGAISLGGPGFGAVSSGSGNDLFETVSWMKDRVSETVNRFRQGSAEYTSSLNSYVITVGN
ncbi:unnamed protein product, partial [Gongylonema pulchrum]|uniref:VPS13_C domain-containing protein n=1 Tax=Gongylonema pulchrum TaxID=637853 RepID=A0A183EHG7_9BILA